VSNILFFIGTIFFSIVLNIVYFVYKNPLIGAFVSVTLAANGLYLLFLLIAKSKRLPIVIILTFTIVYYISGLLPITTRRDYLDGLLWSNLIFFTCISFLFGMILGRIRINKNSRDLIWGCYNLNNVVFNFLFILSFCSCLFILKNHGLLIINPESRFGVSTYWIYFIEFFITAVIGKAAVYICQIGKIPKKYFLTIFVASIMVVVIGYRNQLFILWIGIFLLYLYSKHKYLSSFLIRNYKKIYSLISIGLVASTLMFYMRVQFSTETILNWSDRVIEHEIVGKDYMMPFLIIHDSSRETMGVAQLAFERIDQINNYIPLYYFMWMDISTILPGFSQTATGVLGQVVANSTEMFLTPGSIGGIYISYGTFGICVIYTLMGCIFQRLWMVFKKNNSPEILTLLVIMSVYFIQFTYRGIPKPMYFLALLLVLIMFRLPKFKF
jgi:hypothetical protein